MVQPLPSGSKKVVERAAFHGRYLLSGHLVYINDGIIDGQSDIWVYEWARDTLTRQTSDPTNDSKPVWPPDGRRILFASSRADKSTSNLYWQRADGTGEAPRLTESKNTQRAGSWHPSGKFVAFEEVTCNRTPT